MPQANPSVVVVGGGASGIAAAAAAAATGADVLLIESESTLGGDLISGMPILGSYTARGQQVVGGILNRLVELCRRNGGVIGPVCDWRTVYGLCLNPLSLQLAISSLLRENQVQILLNTRVSAVEMVAGAAKAVLATFHDGRTASIACDYLIDASGSGNLVQMAGGSVHYGDDNQQFQPISLIFRMSGVQYEPLLQFIRANPGEALLAENPALPSDPAEAAQRLYQAGLPYVALAAKGNLLGEAIARNQMYPCTAMFLTPSSPQRGELCINTTRIAGIDPTDPYVLSNQLPELTAQVQTAAAFLQSSVPGFATASLSAIAHRIGIRETGRIIGDRSLLQDDVVNARIPADTICLASHHVDIHGSGTDQVRIAIQGAGAYGIPFSCLLPRNLSNVIAAGRCLASDRGAHGSARVMGSCLATGQAAGTAVALAGQHQRQALRDLKVEDLRQSLVAQGAILELS